MVLRAFNAELAQIPDSVKQEGLVQIRMQWWRDAVKSAYSARPEPNPIILALREVSVLLIISANNAPFGVLWRMLISDRLLYDVDVGLTPVTDASQHCSKMLARPAAKHSCTEALCAHRLAAYLSLLTPDNVLCAGHCTYTKYTEPPAADR